MLITWDEQSSRRFIAASEYTGFHKLLAARLIPYLDRADKLCDIGCGLGRLDLELAPYVREITAVDVSGYAVNTLRAAAKEAGIENIRALCGDAAELKPGYDVVLMSLYGQPDSVKTLELCSRRLIRVAGAGRKSGLYPERHRREAKDAVPVVSGELDSSGVNYLLERHTFEFGQPLETWDDAVSFVLTNAPEAGAREIEEFLNANLQSTGRDDYPYYLPYRKELGIFIVDK
ncbi:MAG: class I SAM-dependent methyltransferase [Oscillospiraceae bacterium]|nr:class I SAM-dependent methyltransferase [Oscillospiraceae bacterium]